MFEPAGDRARWRIAYDLLAELKVGDTAKYEDLGEALDLDPVEDRPTIQSAVRRAAQSLLRDKQHAIEVEANLGYRVVEPGKQLELAHRHRRKAGRQIKLARGQVDHVDFNGMAADTRRGFEVMAIGLSVVADMVSRIETPTDRLESTIATFAQSKERTDEEVAELRARLDRLEGSRKGTTE